MSNRTRGFVLIGVGGLLALVALGADLIGVGAHPSFGWKQIVGTVVGFAVVGLGVRDLRR